MIPCANCSRFILVDSARCPFCEAVQRGAPSPVRPALVGVLLGLALTACGSGSTGDEAGNASSGASTTAPTGSTTMATDGPGMTSVGSDGTVSPTGSDSTVGPTDTDGEAEVTAYGGPELDTSTPEEESAGSDSSSVGSDSSSDTGTSSSSSGQ
jgi:hypothetical protein